MCIEEFIKEKVMKDDSPEIYDFKEECVTEIYNISECKDALERFCRYKMDSPKGFDADGSGAGDEYVCVLARKIYKELFGWNEDTNKRYATITNMKGLKFGPDTMNTFLKKLLPDFLKHTSIIKDFRKIEPAQTRISALMLYRIIVLKEQNFNIHDYLNEDDIERWSQMARLMHTIGNYVLVPAGFNTYRTGAVGDYWDLSLQLMKQGSWAQAGLFRWYINHFFLWDYVREVEDDYIVKSLFSDKYQDMYSEIWDVEGTVKYPEQSRENIRIFIKNVCWAIKRRGIFMIAMIKLKEEKREEYRKVQEMIFDADIVFDGLEKVVEMISEILGDEEWMEENIRKKFECIDNV